MRLAHRRCDISRNPTQWECAVVNLDQFRITIRNILGEEHCRIGLLRLCLDHKLKGVWQLWQRNLLHCMTASWCAAKKNWEQLAGGLIIPDSAKDKPQEGTIISVGKGKTNEEGKLFPLAVKEGDTILFGKYSGTEIKLDGEDFLIMKEEEVLGIVTGTAKKESVIARETVGARK